MLKNRGITLIALVITIIAILILAGVSIAMLTGENGILTKARESKISTELSTYKEQLDLYKVDKISENRNFLESSLNAGKENLVYNTQPEEEKGTIKTVIPGITDEYLEKLEIIKGELLINTQDKNEIELAQKLGISVNPYEIEEGELKSSNGNLLLMDEATGTLTLPDSVTSIGEGAFADLSGLKKIIIPGTVKEIKTNAFANNTDLEEVIINEGVEIIGVKAFYSCAKLQKITIPESVTSIGNACFVGDRALDNVKLPSKLTTLGNNVFSECTNLKNLELSQNLQELKYACLRGTAITKLKFPKNLKAIENQALAISSLQEIDTSENDYYEFKNGILYTKDLKTLVIGLPNITSVNMENTVETITGSAFLRCSKLTNINITENVKSIGLQAFGNSNLKGITVDKNNNYFMADEKNNLYNIDGSFLYRLFDTGNVTIRDGVQNIIQGALVSEITAITLPDSYIGDKVTQNGTFPALDYLYLPKNVSYFNKYAYSNVKTIEVSSENKYLESINNEYIVSEDGTELYWVKNDITDLNIPDTVTIIKSFALCSSKAETIKLPAGVSKIEQNILVDSNVKKIEIQSNIKEIDINAFNGANSLSEVIIHKEKNVISGSPWGNVFGERAISWVGE